MANSKKKRGGVSLSTSSNNSQKSKVERIEEFKQIQKEKNDLILISDERIAAKIKEYDDQISASKIELEAEKKRLEEDFAFKEKELLDKIEAQRLDLNEREEALNNQKLKLDLKEIELTDIENQVRKRCETAVADEVARIRADERQIRDAEKAVFYSEWEKDKANQKADLERYVISQRKLINDAVEAAYLEIRKAEEKKFQHIHEADLEIEAKRDAFTKEYTDKIQEYSKKKSEYERLKRELIEEQAELDADTEYVKELKIKYSQYSEKEVLRLQHQVDHYEERIEVLTERIKELSENNALLQGNLLDNDGHSLLLRIEELQGQLDEARRRNDELANMPSEEEIERLRVNSIELETLKIVVDDEKQKRHEAEAKISAYAMSARELENARVAAAALESLNNQLQMKLKYISEQYKTTQESKFRVLLDIDNNIADQDIFNPKGFYGDLKELCEYIRNYGASKKGLYYSLDTIRVFFASLAAAERASRLLILQGLSGTGKSSLPRLVAEALDVECKTIPVQPSWRDNRELLGYDNDFTNRFKETEFTKYLYEASAVPNRNKIYFIVLDEMNLARIEYYFADFLSVLEKTNQTEWIIPLVSGYSELDEDQKPKYLDYSNDAANICVTNNIWFVGTANNDDSTFLITDKVYDRAQVLDMDKRENMFDGENVPQVSVDIEDVLRLFRDAKAVKANCITEKDKERIEMVDDLLKEMDITFGNRIMSQMDDFVPVYIACGGTKEGAIDYLLTHKILRKLDERYEPYLVTKLTELESGLDEIFGPKKFSQSLTKIKKLREKISG